MWRKTDASACDQRKKKGGWMIGKNDEMRVLMDKEDAHEERRGKKDDEVIKRDRRPSWRACAYYQWPCAAVGPAARQSSCHAGVVDA